MPHKVPSRLKFETERLKAGPITHDITEQPEAFDLVEDPEYFFEEPISASVTLRMVGDSVYMTGSIQTVAKSACGRCLDALRVPLRANIALTFMQDPRLLEPDKYPELVDDNSYWYDGEVIYPAEQFRELLLLELPSIPACELDARNTCPLNGRRFGAMVFGEAEAAALSENDEEDDSLASQLKRMRRNLKG